MQLPHDTTPTALPKLPEGGLTNQLRAPAETLPGDHGARFGEELEQAAARSTGDGAEGRRGDRRSEHRQRADRADRARATDARESRRREASRNEERRREGQLDDVRATAQVGPQDRIDQVRRRVVTHRAEDRMAGSKLPAQTDPTAEAKDPNGATTPEAAPAAGPLGAPTPLASQPAASQAPKAVEAAVRVGATQRAGAPMTAAPTTAEPGKAAPEAGPKAPATSEADPMGELLTRREEALEREASILRQLRAQLGPGRRELTVRLDPAELGRMHLRLALRGGRLTATLRAESPEALTAIERQLPELAASLEAQGFEVQDFDLDLAQGGLADDRGGDATPAAPLPGLLTHALGAEAPRPTTTEPRGPRVAPDSSSPDALDLLV